MLHVIKRKAYAESYFYLRETGDPNWRRTAASGLHLVCKHKHGLLSWNRWVFDEQRKGSSLKIVKASSGHGVQTIETPSFETTQLRSLIWDHSFETMFIWDLLICDSFIWDQWRRRRGTGDSSTPQSFDLSKIRAKSLKICAQSPKIREKMAPNFCRKTHEDLFVVFIPKKDLHDLCRRKFVGKAAEKLFGQVWENSGKNSSQHQKVPALTLIFETTFIWDLLSWDSLIWDHIHVRLVFTCDRFDQHKKGIFSLLVFHFSVKNWSYCGASIKETGRNAKHVILWLGLNDISEVRCSLPNPRHEEFSGLCDVSKCECIYNPAWVTLDTEGRNLAKL